MLNRWTSLVVQWLRLCFHCSSCGFDPQLGNLAHVPQGQKKKLLNSCLWLMAPVIRQWSSRPFWSVITCVLTCILYLNIYFLYPQKYLGLGAFDKHNGIILYVFLFYLPFFLTYHLFWSLFCVNTQKSACCILVLPGVDHNMDILQ